jgi:hypothetical protein
MNKVKKRILTWGLTVLSTVFFMFTNVAVAHESCFWHHSKGGTGEQYASNRCGSVMIFKTKDPRGEWAWRGWIIDKTGFPQEPATTHLSLYVYGPDENICETFIEAWKAVDENCEEEN